jgi:hypothetical protein
MTTDPSVEVLREALRRTLRQPAPRRGRGIVDAILPQAIADRAHAISTDPYTPTYHDVCTARRLWPSQDAGGPLHAPGGGDNDG